MYNNVPSPQGHSYVTGFIQSSKTLQYEMYVQGTERVPKGERLMGTWLLFTPIPPIERQALHKPQAYCFIPILLPKLLGDKMTLDSTQASITLGFPKSVQE